jgi:hypothetical protein
MLHEIYHPHPNPPPSRGRAFDRCAELSDRGIFTVSYFLVSRAIVMTIAIYGLADDFYLGLTLITLNCMVPGV